MTPLTTIDMLLQDTQIDIKDIGTDTNVQDTVNGIINTATREVVERLGYHPVLVKNVTKSFIVQKADYNLILPIPMKNVTAVTISGGMVNDPQLFSPFSFKQEVFDGNKVNVTADFGLYEVDADNDIDELTGSPIQFATSVIAMHILNKNGIPTSTNQGGISATYDKEDSLVSLKSAYEKIDRHTRSWANAILL